MYKLNKTAIRYSLILILLITLVVVVMKILNVKVESFIEGAKTPKPKTPTPTPAPTKTPTPTPGPSGPTPAPTPAPDPFDSIQNILQSKTPYPNNNLYVHKYNLLTEDAKAKAVKPGVPIALPFSFQDSISKLLKACITYETAHSPADFAEVQTCSHYYTSYLLELTTHFSNINLLENEKKTKLLSIYTNSLLQYKDDDGTYYCTLDTIITYMNTHLDFISTIGVINSSAPEFVSNFNNSTVTKYGVIQTETLKIMNILDKILSPSIKTDASTVIPKTISVLQVVNYADKKNL